MTNLEWIRQADAEELADLGVIGARHCNVVICEEHNGNCRECALEWLKEEHDQKL